MAEYDVAVSTHVMAVGAERYGASLATSVRNFVVEAESAEQGLRVVTDYMESVQQVDFDEVWVMTKDAYAQQKVREAEEEMVRKEEARAVLAR